MFSCYWLQFDSHKSLRKLTSSSLFSSRIYTWYMCANPQIPEYTPGICGLAHIAPYRLELLVQGESRHAMHCNMFLSLSFSLFLCVCTLSLEGVQIMSEGVCWFTLLQYTEITKFLHLCFFRLPLPHCDHHLIITYPRKEKLHQVHNIMENSSAQPKPGQNATP